MKMFPPKVIQILKNRDSYPYETQVLAVVLLNYAFLGLISFIPAFYVRSYIYTWPHWLLIVLTALATAEASLRVKKIQIIRELTLIMSNFIFLPLGLYLAGSITTPASIYVLLLVINVCLLAEGLRRLVYFFAIAVITFLFIVIELYFPDLLIFKTTSVEENLQLWSIVYLGVAWVVFREVSSVVNVLASHRKRLTEMNRDLYHENTIDGLTNAFNKKYLMEVLDASLLGLRRKNSSLGILLLDIDDFKAYNDGYGHMKGDDCLKEVVSVINGCLHRDSDRIFRFGGEEFVIILDSTDLEGAVNVAQKILDSFRRRGIVHEYSPTAPYVTGSIGIAVFGRQHLNLSRDDLLKYPDEAMYEAKKGGKNQYKVHIFPSEDGPETVSNW